MGFVHRRVTGRFPILARTADLVIIGGTALRLAQRKGWVSHETASRVGAADSSGGEGVSISELALAAAAALRLVRRARARR